MSESESTPAITPETLAATVAEAVATALANQKAEAAKAEELATTEAAAAEAAATLAAQETPVEAQLRLLTEQMEAQKASASLNAVASYLGAGDMAKGNNELSAIQAFASDPANVPEGEYKELSAMIAAGGYTANMAANELKSRYEASPVYQSMQDPMRGSMAHNGETLQPLSRAEYGKALSEGGLSSVELDLLNKRRAATIKAGA